MSADPVDPPLEDRDVPERRAVASSRRGATASSDDDAALLARLRAGEPTAFGTIFTAYFAALCVFASHYTSSTSAAEEVVEDVLVRMWERRASLAVRSNLRSYLFTAVRNRALNFTRDERAATHALDKLALDGALPGMAEPRPLEDEELYLADLARAVEQAVAALPPRMRQVFTMHRQQGLTCARIGAELSISPKTVENLLGRALKHLRVSLAPFLAS